MEYILLIKDKFKQVILMYSNDYKDKKDIYLRRKPNFLRVSDFGSMSATYFLTVTMITPDKTRNAPSMLYKYIKYFISTQ